MFDWRSAQAAVEAVAGDQTMRVLAELAHGPYGPQRAGARHRAGPPHFGQAAQASGTRGLVDRQVWGYRPLRVDYLLTPRGEALLEALRELAHQWRTNPADPR